MSSPPWLTRGDRIPAQGSYPEEGLPPHQHLGEPRARGEVWGAPSLPLGTVFQPRQLLMWLVTWGTRTCACSSAMPCSVSSAPFWLGSTTIKAK